MPPFPEPQKILITRTDRIGDLVLSTPVFEALRHRYPNAWIACVTAIENRELIEGNPHLNEVIAYDKKGREKSWIGNIFFARCLAAKKFDLVIHLHATNRMHLVTWIAGIPNRIGWSRRLAWTLTEARPDIKREGQKHEAEYNFALLEGLGLRAPAKLKTGIPENRKAAASLSKLLAYHEVSSERPWIVISPSSSCPSKKWPYGSFAVLMDKIAAVSEAQLMVVGAPQDKALSESLRAAAKAPFLDLTGLLTLGMLAELLRRSALLISNDSGPVHIACAVDTPVVSIFGRKQNGLSARRWGPLSENSRVLWKDVGCEVCLAHRCLTPFLCLDVISPEEVFQSAQELCPKLGRLQVFR